MTDMQPTEIVRYLKRILRCSSQITEDEAILLAHAIAQLAARPSVHRRTILDILCRVRSTTDEATVAENLYQSFDDKRTGASHAFVARFAKRRYIYESVDYYFSDEQVLFEHGDEYDATFPIKQPFTNTAPELHERGNRFYVDRMTYVPQSDSFVIESIPEIDQWLAQHIEPYLRDGNLLARHYGRAARVPPEAVEEWIERVRDIKEFYIPGHPDVSTFRAISSEA
jgi:hypothetical protein